jgi:hypothetical protein
MDEKDPGPVLLNFSKNTWNEVKWRAPIHHSIEKPIIASANSP